MNWASRLKLTKYRRWTLNAFYISKNMTLTNCEPIKSISVRSSKAWVRWKNKPKPYPLRASHIGELWKNNSGLLIHHNVLDITRAEMLILSCSATERWAWWLLSFFSLALPFIFCFIPLGSLLQELWSKLRTYISLVIACSEIYRDYCGIIKGWVNRGSPFLFCFYAYHHEFSQYLFTFNKAHDDKRGC